MIGPQALASLTADSYRRHALHAEGTDWPEKNCYADLWIELLHALELEPLAMLGHTLCVDFEGDQWTFFKPQHAELRRLYGVDIQELTVWRPLEEHAVEHLGAGKLVSAEADAFWLPDTAGTDYRTKHTKTTILMAQIDPDARRLGYFHNAGYFELSGEDYVRLFRLDAAPDPAYMPFFAELVRIDRLARRTDAELAGSAMDLLRHYHAWRPAANPFIEFGERFAGELAPMRERGLAHYHAWAFASIRQAGAAFELAAAHLRWLADRAHVPELVAAAERLAEISHMNKALILKGARAVHTGKPFDTASPASAMARDWDEAMGIIAHCVGSGGS